MNDKNYIRIEGTIQQLQHLPKANGLDIKGSSANILENDKAEVFALADMEAVHLLQDSGLDITILIDKETIQEHEDKLNEYLKNRNVDII